MRQKNRTLVQNIIRHNKIIGDKLFFSLSVLVLLCISILNFTNLKTLDEQIPAYGTESTFYIEQVPNNIKAEDLLNAINKEVSDFNVNAYRLSPNSDGMYLGWNLYKFGNSKIQKYPNFSREVNNQILPYTDMLNEVAIVGDYLVDKANFDYSKFSDVMQKLGISIIWKENSSGFLAIFMNLFQLSALSILTVLILLFIISILYLSNKQQKLMSIFSISGYRDFSIRKYFVNRIIKLYIFGFILVSIFDFVFLLIYNGLSQFLLFFEIFSLFALFFLIIGIFFSFIFIYIPKNSLYKIIKGDYHYIAFNIIFKITRLSIYIIFIAVASGLLTNVSKLQAENKYFSSWNYNSHLYRVNVGAGELNGDQEIWDSYQERFKNALNPLYAQNEVVEAKYSYLTTPSPTNGPNLVVVNRKYMEISGLEEISGYNPRSAVIQVLSPKYKDNTVSNIGQEKVEEGICSKYYIGDQICPEIKYIEYDNHLTSFPDYGNNANRSYKNCFLIITPDGFSWSSTKQLNSLSSAQLLFTNKEHLLSTLKNSKLMETVLGITDTMEYAKSTFQWLHIELTGQITSFCVLLITLVLSLYCSFAIYINKFLRKLFLQTASGRGISKYTGVLVQELGLIMLSIASSAVVLRASSAIVASVILLACFSIIYLPLLVVKDRKLSVTSVKLK
ncbi:MAG: hypothetical protein LBI63_04375 [Candidatus Ancillula sp.]|jgi:hypothetical protein|nr:hypothetical protein [Candidatus Ancillula sp.]